MTVRRAKRENGGSGGGSPRKHDDLLTCALLTLPCSLKGVTSYETPFPVVNRTLLRGRPPGSVRSGFRMSVVSQ
jgi:hypothetical protein